MEGERAQWRCRHTAYAICPPRPHRSVRRHAAFRLRPRARRSVSLCTSGPEAVPPPRRRSSPATSFPARLRSRGRLCAAPRGTSSSSRSPRTSTRARCCTRPPSSRLPSRFPWRLPWMSGDPYAAYGRVRARTASGVTAWTKPFGFNVVWDTLPEAIAPVAAWPGAVGPGAGRHELPRVVHGYRQGRRDEDERRRRARVLRVPSRAGLHRIRSLACSRSQDDVRDDPLQLAARHVRPVEQGEHVDEPDCRLRAAEARRPPFRTTAPRARPAPRTSID